MTPSAASSSLVRSASASADASGRLTSTTVVIARIAERRQARPVESRWLCRPASGPRHDVPVVFVSMKPVHAAGSSAGAACVRSAPCRR